MQVGSELMMIKDNNIIWVSKMKLSQKKNSE